MTNVVQNVDKFHKPKDKDMVEAAESGDGDALKKKTFVGKQAPSKAS